MSFNQQDLDNLFAENPLYKQAWDTVQPPLQQDWMRTISLESIKGILDKKIPTLPANAAALAASQKTAQKFANVNFAPSNETGDLLGTMLAAAGITGGAALEMMSHPNPATYHCESDALLEALASLSDDDTKLELKRRNNVRTVEINELVNGTWIKALTVTLTESAQNETVVLMGEMNLQASVGKVVEVSGSLLGIGARLKSLGKNGLLDSLSDIVGAIGSVTNKLPGKVADQLKGIALKFQVWKILDDAARPFEDEYSRGLSAAERRQKEAEAAKQRDEALSRCPACGTAFTPDAINSGLCKQCNFPIPVESIKLFHE